MNTIRKTGVAVAFVTTAACTVPVSTGTAGTDMAGEPASEATGTTADALSRGPTFTPFRFAGGGGGGGPYWLGCGGGEVVAGLFGHSGITTDQLGVVCADLNQDGTIRSYNWPQHWQGGSGGNYFQVVCPANQFATGMDLEYEDTVAGIWLDCQTAAQIRSGYTNPNVVTAVQNFAEYGGRFNCNWAGWDAHALIPPGPAALTGFYVKSATYIDALDPVCVAVNL